jgi:cytochrome bd ubiquinol oxidase subunit II
MLLQDIWFFVWGLLWAIYFITDGFDLGMGTLLPFLGKTEGQKGVIYSAMGPLWNGNEVWLLTAGGVTFAAFPKVYAVMFSSFYAPLMIILFALIVRGVSFEFRHQIETPRWHRAWDTCLFFGSLLPPILLGAAFANIFRGVPFDQTGTFQGSLLTLLNPYGLLGGLLFLLLFLFHGSIWLAIKSEGELHETAIRAGRRLWSVLVIVAIIFLGATKWATPLYDNYFAHPSLFLLVLITVAALLGVRIFLGKRSLWKAWFSSALTIIGTTFFGIIGLYPNMFPSSLNPAYHLTAHNASSSPLTLAIMLGVALVFVPIVLVYQIWAYNLFKGKISERDLGGKDEYGLMA